jgi:hypothetical protein
LPYPEKIIVTEVKKAEDIDDVMLVLFETSGIDVETVIWIAETIEGTRRLTFLRIRAGGLNNSKVY